MKKRIIYLLLVFLVMLAGLISRQYIFNIEMPVFVGDILWGAMIYVGFRFLIVNKSKNLSLVLALGYSYLTEITQLYQGEWINAIRHTTLGALVLGFNFSFLDIFYYTVGIAIIAFLDYKVFKI